MDEKSIVLPDTLVAQLIDNAATLNDYLQREFQDVLGSRNDLREHLINEKTIRKVKRLPHELSSTFSIDGAHVVEIDRASAYSVSCAVCVSSKDGMNEQSSCLALLPHVESLNTLSSGLMIMQEIMLAVECCEADNNAIVFIDGSRISAIIRINQFYTGIARDFPGQLDHWKEEIKKFPEKEPGKTISKFEARDWLSEFLTHPRIVGNLKLVTTINLLEKYAPQWIGRFDDKTFAALILEENEILVPFPLPEPPEPYHIRGQYPYAKKLDALQKELYSENNQNQIFHIYYRPKISQGVFKIEINKAFLKNKEQVAALFNWWQEETCAPDLLEPFSFVIADRFASEAVRVATMALQEITRRSPDTSDWAWYLTQPYRTQ